jgi:ankyrin repeat protein
LVDVVANLLNDEPDRVNAVDLKQWTCLHHAANRNKVTIIDLLVDRGAGLCVDGVDL